MAEVVLIHPRVKDLSNKQLARLSPRRRERLLQDELVHLYECQTKEEVKDWSLQMERIYRVNSDISYSTICEIRRTSWAKYISLVELSPELVAKFSVLKEKTKADRIYVLNRRHLLDWETAFMVIRHGESLQNWPSNFTKADVRRLDDWISGKDIPKMVEYV